MEYRYAIMSEKLYVNEKMYLSEKLTMLKSCTLHTHQVKRAKKILKELKGSKRA